MTDNCTTCRFSRVDYDPEDGYDDGPRMRCHRWPPAVFADTDAGPAQTWPNVDAADWCGEHQPEPPAGQGPDHVLQPGEPTLDLLELPPPHQFWGHILCFRCGHREDHERHT